MRLGTVQQHAQVVAIDPHFAADLVLISLFQKDLLEDLAVALGQLGQYLLDLLLRIFGDEAAIHINVFVGRIESLFETFGAGGGAKLLKQDVVADGIDESSEAFGIIQTLLAFQDDKDTGEGLLADVVDDVLLQIAGPELNKDKFAEIGNEVLLCNGIVCSKALHVSFVECVQLHAGPRGCFS